MNLDGLKRLLGMAGKGVGQAAKAVMPGAGVAGGAAKLMGKPMGQLKNLPTLREPRQLPGKILEPMPAMRQQLQPMAPMSFDNMRTNQMVQQGQLPPEQAEVYPQYGPRIQEDDGMVWGPRGMQPLNQLRQGEPWQNAEEQPFRPRRYEQY